MKIVICIPGNKFSIYFVTSLLATIDYCNSNNIKWAVSLAYSNNLYRSRNLCLKGKFGELKQIPFEEEFEYDKIVWIDSDIIFRPEDFGKLISYDLDIISGVYVLEDGFTYACGYFRNEEDIEKNNSDVKCLTKLEIENRIDLIEVDWIGFGFCCFKKGIFESLEYPFFKPEFFKVKNYIDFYNDDTSICKRLKEKGYKIYVDPLLKVGHEKTKILY